MFAKIQITGEIELVTGMHIGGSSAFAAIGAVDSPIVKDVRTKLPMIPGSSFKGKMRSLLAKEYNENLEFVIPKEGTEVWTDCWAIPKAAKNKEAAEAWINFMLDGDTAETNFEYLTYAIPNKLIADKMDEAVLNPSKDLLDKCETLRNLGAEADDIYSRYWKKYKAE